jgi:hypothetical protein
MIPVIAADVSDSASTFATARRFARAGREACGPASSGAQIPNQTNVTAPVLDEVVLSLRDMYRRIRCYTVSVHV